MQIKTIFYTVLTGIIMLAPPGHSEDLKAYYEQQKAELIPAFKAPQLGSELTLRLAAGQTRTGILMKLTDHDVSLMTDAGSVTYKKTALHESSRAQLFADDFAHIQALERTRAYKQKLHTEHLEKQQTGIHDGRISITSKVEKDSEKEVEEDEKENENTGDTLTTTTTTKTRTEIQKLAVTLSNNTTHPDIYTLEWYFYAKSLVAEQTSLHDSGTEKISVGAKQRERFDITSKTYTTTEVTVDRESSNSGNTKDPSVTHSGTENAGYLVLLKYGDEILDKKSSSKSFLTDEWINTL
jgi:hypothetical protein